VFHGVTVYTIAENGYELNMVYDCLEQGNPEKVKNLPGNPIKSKTDYGGYAYCYYYDSNKNIHHITYNQYNTMTYASQNGLPAVDKIKVSA
jgi:hypothetical protein